MHCEVVPVLPSQRRPDLGIPAGLEAIAMRALEKDPDRRFPTAKEMKAELESAI